MNTLYDAIDMEALLQSASWIHVGKDHWRDPLNDVVYPLDEAFDVQKEREATHTQRMKRRNSTAGLWLSYIALAIATGLAGFVVGTIRPARQVTLNEASGWAVKQVPNSPEYILDLPVKAKDGKPLFVKIWSQKAFSDHDKLLAQLWVERWIASYPAQEIKDNAQEMTNHIMVLIMQTTGKQPVYVQIREKK